VRSLRRCTAACLHAAVDAAPSLEPLGDHRLQRACQGGIGRHLPAYDYACQACDAVVELRHSVNESPSATCAACGGRLRRLFTMPRVNVGNHSSATAARYAKLTQGEEVTRAQAELEALKRPRRADGA
jgi:putative FmdB family regulatory protein